MSIKQAGKSLKSRNSLLSDTFIQLDVLNGKTMGDVQLPGFQEKLTESGFGVLRPSKPEIFQINIGKLCNQTCLHCHVDAGPDRKEEMMSSAHLEKCLEIIERYKFPIVDITGGAPEMHQDFRWFVSACYKLGVQVIDRCNLTIIVANKKYYDLPDFFAANKVEVTSSLPYFSKSRTDSQRGDGVFEDSIKALQLLNEIGYGQEGSGLVLNLVYNPTGSFLPSSQVALEREFKQQLKRKYNVVFNQLFAITNVPISRFLDYLLESGNYDEYMQKLIDAYNPATVNGLMCKNTISVSWDGYIYDCDFNQMLDLPVASKDTQHLDRFDIDSLNARSIETGRHCFACTAGAGSSCGGELI